MTPQDIINRARTTLNDTAATRYPDAELLRYVNDSLDAAYALAKRLFYVVGEVTCIQNETIQRVCLAGASEIIDVIRIKGGNAVRRMDKSLLDAFVPNWHQATPAPAEQWQRMVDDPVRFYLYPPAPANQILEVIYVPSPGEYALTDTLPLPDAHMPALHDFVVFRAHSKDAEYAESEKTAAFFKLFAESLQAVQS